MEESLTPGPNFNRPVKDLVYKDMVSDKKTLFAEANASAKRNLISVGGCTDTLVYVDAAGNADGKRPCLGNGQTVLMRTPTQAEFAECWSESIIRKGLPPSLVDDPLFRKTLVTISRMGQNFESRHTGLATRSCHSTLLRASLRCHERSDPHTFLKPCVRT
jgi:hypothetical protein